MVLALRLRRLPTEPPPPPWRRRFASVLRRRKGAIAFAGLIAALLGWVAWPHLSAGAAGLLAERRGHYVEWTQYVPEERRRWAPLPTNAAVWRTPTEIAVNWEPFADAPPSDPEPLADALDRIERMRRVRYVSLSHGLVGLDEARRFAAVHRGDRLAMSDCVFAPGALNAAAARGGFDSVALSSCSLPPGELAAFAERRETLGVTVAGSDGVGGQFVPFADHPGLIWIDASLTAFNDADLAAVAGCPRLRTLDLHGTAVTDHGLRELALRSDGLRELDLSHTAVTEAGFAALRGWADLQGLDLAETAVTDATVRRLAERCPNLEVLDLSGTNVTDAALPHLARLTSLQNLNLAGTRVTAAAADPVIDWPALESLTLSEALAPPDFPLRGWDELGDGGATLWYVEPAE